MKSIRFENVWRILRNYNFEVDSEIDCDLICTICKKIMINACNAPCGCRFCVDCLKTYLNQSEKYCPRESDYCKSVLINFDNNVFSDQPINHRIAQLRMKCPENCESDLIELKNMEDHIRICNNQRRFCPFINIGCFENNLIEKNMKQHFLSEIQTHSTLLMHWNENLKNEVDSIKNQIIEIKIQNNSKSPTKILTVLLVFIFCLSMFNYAMRMPILRGILFDEGNHVSILDVEIKVNELLKKEFNKKRNNYDDFQFENQLIPIEKIQENVYQRIYTWTIDDFSYKLSDAKSEKIVEIFSAPFLSHKNGYKLMLQVYPNGLENYKDIYFSIFICIMKGSNDDNLLWPFKLNITFEIINQKTYAIHHKKLLTYEMLRDSEAWNKPNGFTNPGIGFYTFIKLKEMETEPGLILDNKVVLRAIINLNKELLNTAIENGNQIVWNVENISQLRKDAQAGINLEIFSEPFYSHRNGYEMILQLFPNGKDDGKDNYLSIYICIKKGPFNNQLKRPYKVKVKINLINQYSKQIFRFGLITDDILQNHLIRDQPNTERNCGLGFPKFVSFEQLTKIHGLIVNDQILFQVTTEF